MSTERPYGEVLDEMDHEAKYQSATITEATPEKLAYRNALMWVFDRLSVDGGMSRKEQITTMNEIGKVLNGRASPAAKYEPNEWDDSVKALRRGQQQD